MYVHMYIAGHLSDHFLEMSDQISACTYIYNSCRYLSAQAILKPYFHF